MSDIPQAITTIRQYLTGTNPKVSPALREAAAAYASACGAANTRLSNCRELLKKGLKTEAINECQTEPDLLDLVASLDFPGREDWEFAAITAEVAVAPRLLIEVAVDLNRACGEVLPIMELMRQHRRLALGRAPLSERLRVLRLIAAADPTNAIWSQDIQAYETARFRELEKELPKVRASRDLARAAAIKQELAEPGWLAAPSIEMMVLCDNTHADALGHAGRTRLRQLHDKLQQARNDDNVKLAGRVRDRIETTIAHHQLGDNEPSLLAMNDDLAWLVAAETRLDREARYQAACDAFQNGIDDDLPPEELYPLYAAVKAVGYGIPADINDAYHASVARHQSATRRRQIISALAGSGFLVVLVLGSWWWWDGLKRSQRTKTAREQLVELISNRDFDTARKRFDLFATHDPDVAQTPEFVALVKRIEEGEQLTGGRAAKFQNALAELRDLPVGDPGEQPILVKLEGMIHDANSRADWEAEKAKRPAVAVAPPKADGSAEQIAQLINELTNFQPNPSDFDASQRYRGEYLKLSDRARKLKPDASTGSSELMAAYNRVQPLLDDANERVAGCELRAEAVAAIRTTLVGEPKLDAFAASLANYEKKFPKDKRSADFAKAGNELPFWKAAVAWDAVLPDSPLARLNPQAAGQLVARCDDFAKTHAAALAVLPAQFPSKLRTLAATTAVRRSPAVAEELVALFDAPYISKLQYVETRDGKFYFKPDPDNPELKFESNGELIVKPVTGEKLNTVGTKICKNGEVKQKGPAPQVEMGKKVSDQLKKFDADNWEVVPVAVVDEITSHDRVDAILRLKLLNRVLQATGRGSPTLQREYDALAKRILAEKVDLTATWMNAADKYTNEQRPLAAKVLEAFAKNFNGTTVRQEIGAEGEEVVKLLPATRRSVAGWVYRDAKGTWRAEVGLIPPGPKKLVIWDGTAWFAVGSCIGQAVKLDPDSPRLAEGRVLFFEPIE